jgi:hypothetical protein
MSRNEQIEGQRAEGGATADKRVRGGSNISKLFLGE